MRAELALWTYRNLETIRNHKKIGIMPEPPRTASGYRSYDDTHVARLLFILRGRKLGFSIEEFHSLLSLVDRGIQSCSEVQALTERHLEDVRSKITGLKRIEKPLADTAVRYSGEEVPECQVFDALAS